MILEILGKVGFDWQVALANFVNFLIIYFILRRFAFGPIGKVISERQNKIKTGLEDAKKAKESKERAEKDRGVILTTAKKEASDIATIAIEQSKKIIENAENKAIDNANKIKNDAQIKIEKDKQKMNELLAAETGSLVIKAFEKTLKENITEEANSAITANMIKKLKKS